MQRIPSMSGGLYLVEKDPAYTRGRGRGPEARHVLDVIGDQQRVRSGGRRSRAIMTGDVNASEPLSYLGLGLDFGLGYDNTTDLGVAAAANDSLATASSTVGVLPASSASSPVAFVASLRNLNVPYAACEALVAVMAVVGNALVILAFQRERRLRRRTNYYIVSLAVADLLVGLLGIPFALLASVGLPHNLHACLFTVSLLVVLCTISIFCLVAVSVDRYWAILHPLGYSRNVSTKKAVGPSAAEGKGVFPP
ncbi:hypothetical protein FOCC_FOCC008984 [Frankliniella occidentalis]|nr:hypothetical protein FOCC_FOCC008984 [Frankliniella occidentalis]